MPLASETNGGRAEKDSSDLTAIHAPGQEAKRAGLHPLKARPLPLSPRVPRTHILVPRLGPAHASQRPPGALQPDATALPASEPGLCPSVAVIPFSPHQQCVPGARLDPADSPTADT